MNEHEHRLLLRDRAKSARCARWWVVTVREALTTAEGEWFFATPRTLAAWVGEWLMIATLRQMDLAHRCFTRAGRLRDASRVLVCVKAFLDDKAVERELAELRREVSEARASRTALSSERASKGDS